MFDDLKKLKDKAKTLTDGKESPDLSLPDTIDTQKLMDDAKSTVDEGFDSSTDAAKRAAGKVKGTFTPPRTETERGFMKEVTHFFCSDCGAKLGPMETKKWKNALKALLGGVSAVAGVALLNPILVFKGASSLSSLKKDDRGMIDKLKTDSKLKDDARNYLVQCEYCGDWVCSKCYLAEKVICNRCASEKGIMDELAEQGEKLGSMIPKQGGSMERQ